MPCLEHTLWSSAITVILRSRHTMFELHLQIYQWMQSIKVIFKKTSQNENRNLWMWRALTSEELVPFSISSEGLEVSSNADLVR